MKRLFQIKKKEAENPEEKIRWSDLYIRPVREKRPGKLYGILFILFCIVGFSLLFHLDAEEPPVEPEVTGEVEVPLQQQEPAVAELMELPDYAQNPGQAQVSYERYEINSIVYELRGTAAYVVGTVGNSKNVKYLTVEQSLFYTYPVVEICEEAFSGCTKLLKIHIPDSVIIIGPRAFFGCERLEKIRLSQELITVGEQAFAGCSSLQSIEMPPPVRDLSADVFEGDTALTRIRIHSSCRLPEGDDPFGLGEKAVLEIIP